MKRFIYLLLLSVFLLLSACAGQTNSDIEGSNIEGGTQSTAAPETSNTDSDTENAISQDQTALEQDESASGNTVSTPEGYQDIMTDESVKPSDVLTYIRQNVKNMGKQDVADMVLRLEMLQEEYLGPLTNKYYNDDSVREALVELYIDGILPISADTIQHAGLKELLTEVHGNGFKTETAEADFFPVIDYGVYKEFSAYLPDDMKEYISLMATESDQKPANDGGLIIEWKEAVRRALLQEQFIILYGQSPKVSKVRALYANYISFLFEGLPNTPDFEYGTKIMNPQLKEALSEVAAKKGDTVLEKEIASYLDVLEKNEFKLTAEVEHFKKVTAAVLSE